MEIFYLKGCPFSLRVIWGLSLFSEEVKSLIGLKSVGGVTDVENRIISATHHHHVELNDFNLLSLPVLFYTNDKGLDTVVRGGIRIMEFLAHYSLKLKIDDPFSKSFHDNIINIRRVDQKASEVMAFLQIVFAHSSDNFMQYLAPRWTRFIFHFQKYLSNRFKEVLNLNYEHLASPLEITETFMNDLEFFVEKKEYKSEYEKVILATLIEMVMPLKESERNPLMFVALDEHYLKNMKKLNWSTRYPNLFRLREEMMNRKFLPWARERTQLTLRKKMKKSLIRSYN